MQNMLYLPQLSKGRIVKAYRFLVSPSDSYCAVLLTDCESESSTRYAHVLVVSHGVGVFGHKCFAVASEVNKMSTPGSGRSHFLCVFPGSGGPLHENLGSSDEWANLEKFEPRAIAIVAERFGLSKPMEELRVTPNMQQYYEMPKPRIMGVPLSSPDDKPSERPAPKPWWQFWKKD
jgi:hypothetical protein